MLDSLMGAIGSFILDTISNLGYLGVGLLMALESACIPIPSEIIMPFAGFLAGQGSMSLWLLALVGAVGCVVGSLGAYAVSAWGGRWVLVRYGKYLLISEEDLDQADRWFERHGGLSVFVARLMPVVRTFIGVPAGVARMPLVPFVLYSLVGSFLWCLGLAWLGYLLGEHWRSVEEYGHWLNLAIVAVIVVAAAWWIRRHLKRSRRAQPADRSASRAP